MLVLLNNGVALRAQLRRLGSVSTAPRLGALPHALRVHPVTSVAVSQASRWGAVIVGVITAHTRTSR